MKRYKFNARWGGDASACPRLSRTTELIIDAPDLATAHEEFLVTTAHDSRPPDAGGWTIIGVWADIMSELDNVRDERAANANEDEEAEAAIRAVDWPTRALNTRCADMARSRHTHCVHGHADDCLNPASCVIAYPL